MYLIVCLFAIHIVTLLLIWGTCREAFYVTNKNKIACIYAYYEKDTLCQDNLRFFLKEGGLKSHVDYFIIINGKCSVPLPKLPNVKIIHRQNKGYDFGAWAYAIEKYKDQIRDYEFVFFMNTSVKGPFTYETDWTLPFISLFKNDVGLVGTSINIAHDLHGHYLDKREIYPHVQSMFFVLKRATLGYLLEQRFFDRETIESLCFQEVIEKKEIGMSLLLLDAGWNISCLLKKYQGIDYRTLEQDVNPTSHGGDPYYVGAYFGSTIAPHDVIFFKTNRLHMPPVGLEPTIFGLEVQRVVHYAKKAYTSM